MQIGNFGTAYFTVVIAGHTFASLVLRTRPNAWTGPCIAAFGWAGAFAIGIAPLSMANATSGPLYGNDGFACGVRQIYPAPQLLFHLVPVRPHSQMSIPSRYKLLCRSSSQR